jgi:tryptophan synthase alpha chain
MNRIDLKFQHLKINKQKAFIAFITAGDPDLNRTVDLVLTLEDAGVDIIELGVPFSDPMADGPTIQQSSYRALQKGVNLTGILEAVKRIRKISQVPIAFMTYYNPVLHYGEAKLISDAKACGVDGLIIPDLPPEEAEVIINSSRKEDVSTIFLAASTTRPDRMRKIVNASSGFIYFVAVTGVTGERSSIAVDFDKPLKEARKLTDKPICVGFGISTPVQAKQMAQNADGVIVGSAIVKQIAQKSSSPQLCNEIKAFIRPFVQAVK